MSRKNEEATAAPRRDTCTEQEKDLTKCVRKLLVLSLLKQGPCTFIELEEQIALSHGTLTRLTDDLELENCITISRIPNRPGREPKLFTITQHGLAQLQKEIEKWQVFVDRMQSFIDD